MPAQQALIRVNEISQVGETRRNAARIAEMTGLSESDRSNLAIIATELATNLVRHATDGQIIVRKFQSGSTDGIELLAIDRGPGMADVGKCLSDGFSTGGTAGTGFGAIRRLSSTFDVFSSQPAGSVIVSRVLAAGSWSTSKVESGVVCIPAPGETLCGDNWTLAEKGGVVSLMIADGLGHGPLAAKASDEAVRIFNMDPFRSPGAIMEAIHSPLRSTRGAAIAIAHADVNQRRIKYAGVGNISGTLIGNGESRGLFSHNGTVGLQMRKVQEFDYDWPARSLLVMFSDGLHGRWDISFSSPLFQSHPAVIAGQLYRDFTRGRDDLTVLAIR